jgi:hypothetical protein
MAKKTDMTPEAKVALAKEMEVKATPEAVRSVKTSDLLAEALQRCPEGSLEAANAHWHIQTALDWLTKHEKAPTPHPA